jgi:hypothetical protein
MPEHVQSILTLALGGLLLVGALVRQPVSRAACVTVALTALLIFAFLLPIPIHSFTMGDGTNIVERRESFEELVHAEREIRFSSHLAYLLLDRIDMALGSTPTSPLQSYRTLSWLAGAMFALSLVCLAGAEHWSPRAIRYIALAILAPATLMYFGYLEVGYLTLSAAAFPFVARDLHKGGDLTPGLLAGAIMYGLGAAMHGVGYLGIAGLCVAVLAADIPIGRRVLLATALGAIAVGAALIWLWYYIAVLGLSVIPYHAIGGAIWRPVWEAREAESRIIHPLWSTIVARDLFASGLVAGLSLLPVVLGISRQWSRESRVALAFSVPCLIFFVFFWPVQGIAIEMDMVVAAFPAIYPLLWVSSQSVRASLASAGLLALGHWTFWRVVSDERFINDMLR